jgi:hypothetical protein
LPSASKLVARKYGAKRPRTIQQEEEKGEEREKVREEEEEVNCIERIPNGVTIFRFAFLFAIKLYSIIYKLCTLLYVLKI